MTEMQRPQSTSAETAAEVGTAVVRSWGLFTALAMLMLGNGLLGTLLGVRSEIEGFALRTTGVVMAMYYVGFLVGSQVVPRLVSRVGYVRAFAGLASLASVAALVHAVLVNPMVWSSMRLLTGLCQAGLYVVAESWLNELTTNRHRGKLLSAYMVVIMGGMAVGQYFVAVGDPGGFALFVVASAMVSLAVVPVSLSIGTAPPARDQVRMRFRELWGSAPLGLVSGMATGLSNGALVGIGAVYAARVGMSTGRIAVFMSAALIGGLSLQGPIGFISDRVHRRRAILAVTMFAALTAGLASNTDPASSFLLVAMFIFGGLTFPMYALSLSHVNDVLPADKRVSASAMFVFVTGVGAIAGPLVASVAMDGLGPEGFWWAFVVVHVAVGLFVVFRMSVKAPVSISDQQSFARIPARASAVVARIASRANKAGRNGSRSDGR